MDEVVFLLLLSIALALWSISGKLDKIIQGNKKPTQAEIDKQKNIHEWVRIIGIIVLFIIASLFIVWIFAR